MKDQIIVFDTFALKVSKTIFLRSKDMDIQTFVQTLDPIIGDSINAQCTEFETNTKRSTPQGL